MRARVLALGTAVSLTLAACAAPDDADDGGGSGDDLILDATVTCDPTASMWDDLFTWEVETVERVIQAQVEAFRGETSVRPFRLTEVAPGVWYGEEWADVLDAHCDDWSAISFVAHAQSDNQSDSVAIEP